MSSNMYLRNGTEVEDGLVFQARHVGHKIRHKFQCVRN